MNRLLSLLAILLFSLSSLQAQSPLPYRIFTGEGREVSFEEMIRDLSRREVVFFGEQHNCPVSHWMELLTLTALHESAGNLVLGMEMFEADVQPVIDEYMGGLIREERFLAESRPWPNHDTDYAALVDYAHEHRIPLIATNVPRRYADVVNKKGAEVLEQEATPLARSYMAPLPIAPEESQKEMFAAMMSMGGNEPDAERLQRLQAAQSLKDATMAYFIHKTRRPGTPFLHINGSFHSVNGGGIISYLRQLEPSLSIGTITTGRQENIDQPDEAYLGTADYLILVPESFPCSY